MGMGNELLKAAANAALALERVDAETAKWRMQTCKGCDRFDPNEVRCKVCRCFLEVKTECRTNRNLKRGGRIEVTHCPLGRWEDFEIADHYREIDGLAPLTQ